MADKLYHNIVINIYRELTLEEYKRLKKLIDGVVFDFGLENDVLIMSGPIPEE